MTGSPRSSRTVVAVSGAFSLLPPRILSAWLANHSLTRSYARSRSDGLITAMSLVNCSVSTNKSTYFMAHPLCISVDIFRPHNEDDRRQPRYDTRGTSVGLDSGEHIGGLPAARAVDA